MRIESELKKENVDFNFDSSAWELAGIKDIKQDNSETDLSLTYQNVF